MSYTAKQKSFIDAAINYNDTVVAIDFDSVTKTDLNNIAESAGLKFPHWLTRVPTYKVGRGLWSIPVNGSAPVKATPVVEPVVATPSVPVDVPSVPVTEIEMTKGTTSTVSAVPSKDPLFVAHGHFSDINSILKSEMFYPVFVTGLSGNGKTFMVEQAAAKTGRELFRVNITTETDEDDLLGGFRLVNGETVWFDGPVV